MTTDHGLNISLADVYANMYLDNMISKSGKQINSESVILMHDSSLVYFTTANGLHINQVVKLQELDNQK